MLLMVNSHLRFLFAHLYLKILSSQKTSPNELRNVLEELPMDQEGLYKSLMDRVESNQEKVVLAALKWVTFSKERLSLKVLLHALAIESRVPMSKDSDIGELDLIDPRDLLSSCAGFLVVDEESEIVHLVH
jgi:hypothetical protein